MNQVNEVIDNICNKLGTAASELVPQLVKYRIVIDSVYIALGLLLALACVVVICLVIKRDDLDTEDKVFYCGFPLVGIVLAVPIILFNVSALAGWIIAPDVTAIQYITGMIG